MNIGAFGENFPYSNFHDLNMDWIIKIAKDFLDQYTTIQDTIDQGLTDLETKADTLENLLQSWYDTHSQDIANQLASALADMATALTSAISSFNASADAKAQQTIASIPADYTELSNRVGLLQPLAQNTDIDTYKVQGRYLKYGVTDYYVHDPLNGTPALFEVVDIDGTCYQKFTEVFNNGRILIRMEYPEGTWKRYFEFNAIKPTYAKSLNEEIGGVSYKENSIVITPSAMEYGIYTNQTGELEDTTSWKRTNQLIRVTEKTGIGLGSSYTNYVYAIFFNSQFEYIGYSNLQNTMIPCITPPNTCYMGINWQNTNEFPASLTLTLTTAKEKTFFDRYTTLEDGAFNIVDAIISESDITYDDAYVSICIPYPKFKYAFVTMNFNDAYQCICRNSAMELIDNQRVISFMNPVGKLYEIPSGTASVIMNIPKDGYVSVTYEDELDNDYLSNKQVCAIGDSITYIDGRTIGGVTRAEGWQKQLRKSGAVVQNYGYSGYSYADSGNGESVVTAFKNEVITLTNYDIVVLMAGLNDERVDTPLGNQNTTYQYPNTDITTFRGAVGNIIAYLRNQNPNIRIYICGITPSEDSSREYGKWTQYNNALKDCCDYWNVPFIDVSKYINTKPKQANFSEYFYDTTHPNAKGMTLIGDAIAKYINNN